MSWSGTVMRLGCLGVVLAVGLVGVASGATLVHEWRFEGDVNDTSASGNYGQVVDGNAVYVPGAFGQAVMLEPGVSIVDANASNLPVDANDAWSMNIWMNFEQTPVFLGYMAGFGGATANDNPAANGSRRGFLQFGVGYYAWGYSVDLDSGVTYDADGQWHMYTITFDGNDLSMYRDAELLIQQPPTLTGAPDAQPVSYIDTLPIVQVGGASFWGATMPGSYDEFTIWEGALSQEEVDGLLMEKPVELVHSWRFEGNTDDTSGSGNDGAVVDGNAVYVPGAFGQAVMLEPGVSIVDPNASNLPIDANDAWSMNIWMNLDQAPVFLGYIAGFGGATASDNPAANGSRRAYLQFGAGYYAWGYSVDLDSGVAYDADGLWHMYTITFDGTDLSMYRDAELLIQQPPTLTGAPDADPVSYIDTLPIVQVGGTSFWGATMPGSYDEFSIWRGALNQDDVNDLLLNPADLLGVEVVE